MPPTAETTAASASAPEVHGSPETTLLPTDRHYRMTGEKTAPSGDKDERQDEKDEQDTAATSDTGEESETAAASEAAEDEQDTEDEQEEKAESKTTEKPAKRSQSRWEQLSKRNRELTERLARLEAGQNSRETKQEPRPATQTTTATATVTRPNIDDVDASGNPKYATYEDWEAAKDDWLRKDTVREVQETAAKQQQEQQREQATKRVAEEFGKRCEAARKKYADYDDVALNPDLPIKEGGVVDAYIVSRPNGSDVLYHLGANPETLDAINKMNPIDAVYALSEIELGLSAAPAPRPVTRAARPPHQTSTQGTVQRDAIEEAVKSGDSLAYRRAANERDPRLLAVRNSRRK